MEISNRPAEDAPETTEPVIPENRESSTEKPEQAAGTPDLGSIPVFKLLGSWIIYIAAAVLLALLLTQVIFINAHVPSGSMENTIMTNSRVLGFRLSYAAAEPARGDIIIFRFPDDERIIYIKRIIGLPGETVEIKEGVTYIDGAEYEEFYLKETPDEKNFGPYTVPEGSYFVMGDNRNDSKDARYWKNTFVTKKQILGRAILLWWPFSDFQGL